MDLRKQRDQMLHELTSVLSGEIVRNPLSFEPDDDRYYLRFYSEELNRSAMYVELGDAEGFEGMSGLVSYWLRLLEPTSTWSLQVDYCHGEQYLDELHDIFREFFGTNSPDALSKRLERLKQL